MVDRPRLRLATRGSPLALWQAHRVAGLLAAAADVDLVVVETTGDRRTDVPLHTLGGQGVFVKEVQAAVVRGDADLAVHSAKDLPSSEVVEGLVIAAFPERADPRDLLVGATLPTLPAGAAVATGSARRRVQLANLRPDLTFADLRGNLGTRLAAVGRDDITAVVVAKAAVDRLGWQPPEGVPVECLEAGVMVPQVGQGALAIECRSGDDTTRALVARLDDPRIRRELTAERAFLAELGGGCTLPVGAHAVADGPGPITLSGFMGAEDGRVVLRHRLTGEAAGELGRSLARYLLDDAGGASLGTWVEGTAEPDAATGDATPGDGAGAEA